MQATINSKKVFEKLSQSDRQFVTLAVLDYAAQKICPDIFLANVAREYVTKKIDGATAASVAYSNAAKLAAEQLN